MEARDIIFDTVPLWIGFKGLELEHYKLPIIWIIASAAEEIDEIFSKDIISRTLNGYRAKVEVDARIPLVEGTMANTLSKSEVYVEFLYVGLLECFCVHCRMLGHDRFLCLGSNLGMERGDTIEGNKNDIPTQRMLLGLASKKYRLSWAWH